MQEFKVLLVDDEQDFVESLAERVKMRDVAPDVALNGEEALKHVEHEIPDVMVLDLKMPGIDGMEVLRQVRKAYPNIQVIILTGHGSEKHEEEAPQSLQVEKLLLPWGRTPGVRYGSLPLSVESMG